ncbi:MAG: uridylate kinase [Methanosarcinales archaeon]|nr:uridylate kinase [Methanosarcinales archaeon]
MTFFLVKVGGSLMENARALIRALCALSARGHGFLVVPGGGPMADLVRDLYARGLIGGEAAHWMAVLAMEQYAYMLSDGTGAALTSRLQRVEAGVHVLLPYLLLREDDRGLEHSWDYTSDSVAALAASRLGLDFIKATDVDGIILDGEVVPEVAASSLLQIDTCVDQGTLRILISSGRDCRVLRGTDPEDFIEAIFQTVGGTIIRGQ